jgi:hypothetical protein
MDEEEPRTKSDGETRRASRTGYEADATKASTAPKQDPNTIFDDLDEDTRVLRGKGDGGIEDVVEAAREKLRLDAEGVRARSDTTESPTIQISASVQYPPPHSPPMESAVAEFRAPAEARAPQLTVAGIGPAAMASQALREAPLASQALREAPLASQALREAPLASTHDGAAVKETRVLTPAELDAVGPVTERPSRVPPKSLVTPVALQPAAAPRRMDALPAIRVAVLATDVPGEVRLMALHEGDDAPPGAALALLVPLTTGDGESMSHLFRGGE